MVERGVIGRGDHQQELRDNVALVGSGNMRQLAPLNLQLQSCCDVRRKHRNSRTCALQQCDFSGRNTSAADDEAGFALEVHKYG
jgi:hypothetical protein